MKKYIQLQDGRTAIEVCSGHNKPVNKWGALVMAFCFLFIASASYHQHKYGDPQIVETVEASEAYLSPDVVDKATGVSQGGGTHYVVEYYVDNVRYVRWLKKDMLELVTGTAKDFGQNPNHLLGICLQEGTEFVDGYAFACSPTAVGDNGHALGAFQIHTGINTDVSKEDAKHAYYSARWTAERLQRKGYATNPKRAVQCHNGCNASLPYANRVWQIARTLKIVKEVTL